MRIRSAHGSFRPEDVIEDHLFALADGEIDRADFEQRLRVIFPRMDKETWAHIMEQADGP